MEAKAKRLTTTEASRLFQNLWEAPCCLSHVEIKEGGEETDSILSGEAVEGETRGCRGASSSWKPTDHSNTEKFSRFQGDV